MTKLWILVRTELFLGDPQGPTSAPLHFHTCAVWLSLEDHCVYVCVGSVPSLLQRFVCGGCPLNRNPPPPRVMIPVLPKALNHDHHLSPCILPFQELTFTYVKVPLHPAFSRGSSPNEALRIGC